MKSEDVVFAVSKVKADGDQRAALLKQRDPGRSKPVVRKGKLANKANKNVRGEILTRK